MGFSCPRYFPSSPSDFGGSFIISYHFNYCSANPGFDASSGVQHEIHSPWPLSQNWFSFSLFLLTGRRCHFRFRVLANHLASIFFLPLSGDSLGLLYVSVPHSLPIWSQTSVGFHSDLDLLLRDWPTLSLLMVILWWLANSNTRDSRNSLFLFSQWETMWHNVHCKHWPTTIKQFTTEWYSVANWTVIYFIFLIKSFYVYCPIKDIPMIYHLCLFINSPFLYIYIYIYIYIYTHTVMILAISRLKK